MERLLKPTEVATLLGCSVAAVYKWTAQGRLRPARAGTLLRFPIREIERFTGLRRGSLHDSTASVSE